MSQRHARSKDATGSSRNCLLAMSVIVHPHSSTHCICITFVSVFDYVFYDICVWIFACYVCNCSLFNLIPPPIVFLSHLYLYLILHFMIFLFGFVFAMSVIVQPHSSAYCISIVFLSVFDFEFWYYNWWYSCFDRYMISISLYFIPLAIDCTMLIGCCLPVCKLN